MMTLSHLSVLAVKGLSKNNYSLLSESCLSSASLASEKRESYFLTDPICRVSLKVSLLLISLLYSFFAFAITDENIPTINVRHYENQVGEACARHIADLIIENGKNRKKTVLGLMSDNALKPVYKALRELIRKEQIDVSNVIIFSFDEYAGISPENPLSHYYFMFVNLFEGLFWSPSNPLGFNPKNIYLPEGEVDSFASLSGKERIALTRKFNPKKKRRGIDLSPEEVAFILQKRADRYDVIIKKLGPIQVQLLTLDHTGSMGFLDEGTPFTEGSNLVALSLKMRRAKATMMNSKYTLIPEYAITMGIDTLLQAESIFLFATGKNKAPIINEILEESVTPDIPASVLKLHPHVEFFLDRNAAKKLKNHYKINSVPVTNPQ